MNNRETTSGQERPQPGGWQEEVNEWGGVRRFRMIGGIKEYELMITVDGGIKIPESQLEDYNRRKKVRQAAPQPGTRDSLYGPPHLDGEPCEGGKQEESAASVYSGCQ